MSDEARVRVARGMLSTLPLVMRSLHVGMRESGGEVTGQQHRLLNMLAAHPTTPSQISRVSGVTPATATSLISTMEARGWVSRAHDEGDRRRVVVAITDEGRERVRRSQLAAEAAMVEALSALDDAEIERLLGGLEVLDGLRERLGQEHCSHPAAHGAARESGHQER